MVDPHVPEGRGPVHGHGVFGPLQGDRALVQGQAVEAGPEFAGKGLEPVKGAVFLEGGGVAFQGDGGAKDARAAAGAFLIAHQMGRRVRAEEELRVAAGGGAAKGEAVNLSLRHGQAKVVGAHAPHQQIITVQPKMMGRDGCRKVRPFALHVGYRLRRGDVLKHDLQLRMALAQGL